MAENRNQYHPKNMDGRQHNWTERYRPANLDELVLPARIIDLAGGMLAAFEVPNLLLFGPPGSGKNSLARILQRGCSGKGLLYNGGEATPGDLEAMEKAGGNSFYNGRQVNIVDEIDALSTRDQNKLRKALEPTVDQPQSFILTTNHPAKVMKAVHSRCHAISFNFDKFEREEMRSRAFDRCRAIVADADIEVSDDELVRLIDLHSPDLRQLVQALQMTRYKTVPVDVLRSQVRPIDGFGFNPKPEDVLSLGPPPCADGGRFY